MLRWFGPITEIKGCVTILVLFFFNIILWTAYSWIVWLSGIDQCRIWDLVSNTSNKITLNTILMAFLYNNLLQQFPLLIIINLTCPIWGIESYLERSKFIAFFNELGWRDVVWVIFDLQKCFIYFFVIFQSFRINCPLRYSLNNPEEKISAQYYLHIYTSYIFLHPHHG